MKRIKTVLLPISITFFLLSEAVWKNIIHVREGKSASDVAIFIMIQACFFLLAHISCQIKERK